MERATRVAAIYDIHGNLTALEAVLAEIDSLGIERIVVGGDLAWGPQPVETVSRLLGLGPRARFVRGNADREVGDRLGDGEGRPPELVVITRWCADRLSPGQRAFLATLPERVTIDIAGLGRVLFCHGSPLSDEDPIRVDTPEETIAPWLEDVREATIVCGHTHAPFDRQVAGKRIVNAGSVGLQYGAGASWALLGPEVELRRTPYDVELAAERIARSGVPDADGFVAHVRTPPPMPGEPLPPLTPWR
ncbi:MAG TPA: metallophosphoesterase family protein [Methylomirabilota bacterium]|nr:metallophosphoesterase family protein [Methylomirabilota bacterium]